MITLLPKPDDDRRCLFGAGLVVVLIVIVVAYGQRAWRWLKCFAGLEYS